MKYLTIFLISSLFLIGCSKNKSSIYGDLAPDEDGVINSDIEDDGKELDTSTPPLVLNDNLTADEKSIVVSKYSSRYDKFNFVIVEADSMNVMRSYRALTPARLASVTKLATSITALENVDGIGYDKVRSMLKSSNNGEASRYLRLAVKALNNYIVPGSGYTAAASCPTGEVAKEATAAGQVLSYVKSKITIIDWSGAALKDGAGCDYGNFMSPVQIATMLAYADQQGPVYGGKSFETFLSISGVDGTWAGKNTDTKGQVLAKTGTLNPNANLAGYFYAKRDGKMRKYYFAMLVTKTDSSESAKARTFIESMVRYWIKYYSAQKGEAIAHI